MCIWPSVFLIEATSTAGAHHQAAPSWPRNSYVHGASGIPGAGFFVPSITRLGTPADGQRGRKGVNAWESPVSVYVITSDIMETILCQIHTLAEGVFAVNSKSKF